MSNMMFGLFRSRGPSFSGSFESVVETIFSTVGDRQTLAEFLKSCDAKLAQLLGTPGATDLAPGRKAALDAARLDLQAIVVGVDVTRT